MSTRHQTRFVSIRQPAAYLFTPPESSSPDPWAVVALHGYGQTPQLLHDYARRLTGDTAWVAAPRGLNEFSLRPLSASPEVGYNWGTSAHWSEAIDRHHQLMLAVLEDVQRESGVPAARTLLMGFSQPVGLNYRFAGTHPEAVRAVLGLCGGVPKHWETLDLKPITAALMHIARDDDEFYPREVAGEFGSRLRLRAADVEFQMIPGKHRLPSAGAELVAPWIERVFGVQAKQS